MLAMAPFCGRWRSGMIFWHKTLLFFPLFFFFSLSQLLLFTLTLGIEHWAPFIVDKETKCRLLRNAKLKRRNPSLHPAVMNLTSNQIAKALLPVLTDVGQSSSGAHCPSGSECCVCVCVKSLIFKPAATGLATRKSGLTLCFPLIFCFSLKRKDFPGLTTRSAALK